VEPWDKIRHTLKVRLKSFKRRSRAA
jgi:hypothetical protein